MTAQEAKKVTNDQETLSPECGNEREFDGYTVTDSNKVRYKVGQLYCLTCMVVTNQTVNDGKIMWQANKGGTKCLTQRLSNGMTLRPASGLAGLSARSYLRT